MAMRRERMKDAGDGDGEGGGEISTQSNSDLQELEEKEMGKKEMGEKEKEKEKENDMRAMETKMERLAKEKKWEKEKEMWEKEKEMLWQVIINMKMSGKEKGMWIWKMGNQKRMWKEIKMVKEVWKEEKKKWEEKLMWEERKMMEMMEEERKMMGEEKKIWEEYKEIWENKKEKWEKVKEKWEKDEEIRVIWGTKMGTKMKEKEPEPLPEWEMGMEKSLCLLGCGPEGKEPVLYYLFNLLDPEGKAPVLYLFNLLDERKSKIVEDKEYEDGKQRPGMQVITPAESIRPRVYYDMSIIVGSLLYVLGGVFEDPENEHEWSFHNEVFLFDINHPQKGWIKGPNMLNERCNGKAVAVESKIYVFGGVEDNSSTSRPWAEFLDPDKNKWEPLPAPPDIHTRDLLYNPVVFGVPGEGKKIFLSCCYYIYDVNVRTWEEFCPPESLPPFSHNLTNDGNILYWTTFGHLYSFDMKTQDIDCGLVEGYRLSKYQEELLIPEPTLHHLDGDYFCFITLKDLPEDCTKVRCTKFQVSHQGGLKASVVCRETCIIGHPLDIDNTYAFILNGKLGAEKSEGSSVF